MENLLKVSIRQQALFISQHVLLYEKSSIRESTLLFVSNLARLGFGVSEKLLQVLNGISPDHHERLLHTFQEVTGVNKNWTPLVKGWDTPTGETVWDHIITFFANVFGVKGTQLPCGHVIPPDTFPIERYNGCPFCGTPFEFGKLELHGQGSKLKILELWTEAEATQFLGDLLTSKTALDATQQDSLRLLLEVLPLPEVEIGMKETLMQAVDIYVDQHQAEKAQKFFTSPTDILRYLWYKHTGYLQIVEPRTIIRRKSSNRRHIFKPLDKSEDAKHEAKEALKLKYTRTQCLMVAQWLNNLHMPSEKMAEIMHPKRQIWVRIIRALRLAEYSRRKGFEKLTELMDVFYHQKYTVWQGRVDHFRLKDNVDKTLTLLKQRPGMFARSLFANMLWFGPDPVLDAFEEIIDQIPARLVFTLNMYAANYFNPENTRTVKPLGGGSKNIPHNPSLLEYNKEELKLMIEDIEELSLLAVKKRFAAQTRKNKSIYIDPMLFNIPVAIGDRSDNIQDLPSALMGTRFPVEGNTVRLFMQWGEGLPAQHLDMDLSCHIAYAKKNEICSFGNLTATGCKHSGDIRSIPDQVGTAEYIEINLPQLQEAGAQYVTFTCNAYSVGEITPNMVLGWMSSAHPMVISQENGVAYDPSCVQHQVRITRGLSKGLVFGVLEIESREVIWLEMDYYGQVVQNLDIKGVKALLQKLNSKISIGNLLKIKAEAQKLEILEVLNPDAPADEVYTTEWAKNTAAVTQLLVG
ncbi:MAG: hypothetical protein NW226_12405 [Microscillaceae bacterium]|nr:hypothetical protein [Microscillaceae bacterium]